jgi:hypothetical protein
VEEGEKGGDASQTFPRVHRLTTGSGRALLHFAQTPSEITVLMARYGEKLGKVDQAA